MIYVPLVLVAVLISARSSAEWISDVSKISDSLVSQRLLAVGKRRLRLHGEGTEEPDEERAGPPPLNPEFLASLVRNGADSLAPILDSSMPSLRSIAEPLSSNVPNKDVSLLKRNIAFTRQMEKLRVNIDDVVATVQPLRTRKGLPQYMYNDYTLTLMALGSKIFSKVERPGTKVESIHSSQLTPVIGEYVNSDKFKRWKADRKSAVSLSKVYGKMRWLVLSGGLNMIDKEDLADMAFGSEFFKTRKIELTLPSPIQGEAKIKTLDQLKHQIEQLAKRDDVDPKVRDKIRAFAENPDFIGKTNEELLRIAKDAVFDDEVDHLKSNKAFLQRMEELGIDVDDVKLDVPRLQEHPKLSKYDEFSLYMMALGSKYFERDGANIKSIKKQQFESVMGPYATSAEFKGWMDERKHSLHGILGKIYGKMSWLILDEHLKLLKVDELANMAFGSEVFKISKIKVTLPSPIQDGDKIETLDQLNRLKIQLPNNGKPDVNHKVIDILKEDPKTLIGQTAEQLKRKAIHETLGLALKEEANKKQKSR